MMENPTQNIFLRNNRIFLAFQKSREIPKIPDLFYDGKSYMIGKAREILLDFRGSFENPASPYEQATYNNPKYLLGFTPALFDRIQEFTTEAKYFKDFISL